MDIAAIKTELAGLLGSLLAIDRTTGLPYADPYREGETVRAYVQARFSLPETDLPAWIIFTNAATYPVPPDQTVERLARETRDMALCLYVSVAQSGTDGEAEAAVEPYIEMARNLIQSHPLLYDGILADIVPGIMRAYLVRDEGVVVLKYGMQNPIQYNGLRFTLRIEGYNEVLYGNE